MRAMKVIMPAGQIPLGSTVTKIKGEKPYNLTDRLRVFSSDGSPRRDILAEKGTVFLVHEGDANAIAASTEVVWLTNSEELLTYLGDIEMERDSR